MFGVQHLAPKSKKRQAIFDLGDYDDPNKRSVHNVSQWWAFAVVAGVLVLSSISKYQLLSLPRALTANDEVIDLVLASTQVLYRDLGGWNDSNLGLN